MKPQSRKVLELL